MANVLSNLRGLLAKGIAIGFLAMLALSVGWLETVSDAVPSIPLCRAGDVMLRFKDGVSVTFTPQVNRILEAAEYSFQAHGYSCVCTAGTDGKHMEGSLHYKALAVDLRSRHVAAEMLPKIVSELKERLGKDYDVIIEGDHVHAEFDPKTA